MASLTAILFNANPLMRLDGYYILADLVEIQNLYASGRQYLRHFFLRRFCGVRTSLPAWTRSKRLAIGIYAWASLCWRLMVSVSLIIVAGTLFHGAGLVLAAISVAAWFGRPIVRLIRYLSVGDAHGRPSLLRCALMSVACGVLAAAVLRLPWPGGATAPGVVEYAPLDVVRASGDGFVREVPVRMGQWVKQGQVLAVLINDQLQRDLEDLQLAIEQSSITSRVLHRGTDMGKYQIEMEHQLALIKRKEQLEKQLSEMTPRAARSGRVVAPHLDSLVGTYVTAGTQLMVIGAEHKKEVRLSIAEERVDSFARAIDSVLHLRVRGRARVIRGAPLSKIEPQASVHVDHSALAASSGGPLAVRHVSDRPGQSGSDTQDPLQLVAPRFTGIVALPEDVSRSLRSGQLVRARLMDHDDTIGRRVHQTISQWVRSKLQRARTS